MTNVPTQNQASSGSPAAGMFFACERKSEDGKKSQKKNSQKVKIHSEKDV
jgi:hypothetical protein